MEYTGVLTCSSRVGRISSNSGCAKFIVILTIKITKITHLSGSGLECFHASQEVSDLCFFRLELAVYLLQSGRGHRPD